MRIALILEGATDPRRRTPAVLHVVGTHALAWAFLAGSWTIFLAGCALDDGSRRSSRVRNENAPARAASPTRARLPSRALMKPLPSPNCEESGTQSTANPADPNAELARRIRAEYELVCYRMAEALARQRLRQLQVWIGATRDRAVRALPEEQRE